jgi:hypothetical protein
MQIINTGFWVLLTVHHLYISIFFYPKFNSKHVFAFSFKIKLLAYGFEIKKTINPFAT